MITFTKLTDGTWGIRVPLGSFVVEDGDEVEVTKRDRSCTRVTVGTYEYTTTGPHAVEVYRIYRSCQQCRMRHCGPRAESPLDLCAECDWSRVCPTTNVTTDEDFRRMLDEV